MTLPTHIAYEVPTGQFVPESAMAMDLDPARAALLVHDMQEHFLGAYEQAQQPYRSLTSNVATLLSTCRAAGIPVVYSRQPAEQRASQRLLLSERWGPGITAHPDRQAIDASVAPGPQDVLLNKFQYSAFQQTDLESLLRKQGRDQLIVCGVYAHIGCLLSSAEAFMRGIKPFYVADAMADFDAERHRAAAHYVARVCGVVCSTAAAVQRLSNAAADSAAPQETLRRIAEGLLEQRLSDVAPQQRLDDLGLDSLRMMALLEGLEDAGLGISQADLLECVTWGDLLDRLPAGETSLSPAEHTPLQKPRGPRMVQVRAMEQLSPRMMRAVLQGPDLAGFPAHCPGAHIKLFFPLPGQAAPVLPTRDEAGKIHWPPDEVRPVTRTYSVRGRDVAAGTLTVDLVLHQPDGPASHWAKSAQPGDAVGVAGPGGNLPQWQASSHALLVGDLSALPAIEALLECAPASMSGDVFVVVPEASERRALPRPAGVSLHFLCASAGAAPGSVLERLQELSEEIPRTHYVVAGEQVLVAKVRAHCLALDPERAAYHYAVPFWKAREDEEAFHAERHRLMDSYEEGA